jgi:hypothetical protein
LTSRIALIGMQATASVCDSIFLNVVCTERHDAINENGAAK